MRSEKYNLPLDQARRRRPPIDKSVSSSEFTQGPVLLDLANRSFVRARNVCRRMVRLCIFRQAPIFACLLLSACASERLTVAPIDIADQDKYLAHVAECTVPAQTYRPNLTVGQVIFGAIGGALDVASYAFLYPLMPLAGAGSGAAKSALAPFDPTGHARQNIFRHCMTDKVNRDLSATIANPDD